MQQSGEYRIGAPVSAVWQALNDPQVLARCIDGCQAMDQTGDNAFRATVRAKVGPVSAPFTANVAMADIVPLKSYTLQADVKGGPAGFGKGVARVALAEDEGATLLRYEVEGSVGGKLAQVGQRLIDGAARKMADDFFAKFGEAVAPGASQAVAAPEPPAAPAASAARALPVTTVWLIVIVAVAAAFTAAFLLFR